MNPAPKMQKAVALKYDKEKSDAPKVVAKGKGFTHSLSQFT